MATDATGSATSPDNIPTYATSADAPSGKGFNAAMAAIQTALNNKIGKPTGLNTNDVPVWNGTTWVRPTGTPSSTTYLRGDGSWAQAKPIIAYTTQLGTSGVIVSSSASTFSAAPNIFSTPISITFDGISNYFIEISAMAFGNNTANAYADVVVSMDGNQNSYLAQARASTTNDQTPLYGRAMLFTPTAGTHSVNARLMVNSGGTASVFDGGNTPAVLSIIQILS